jgi:hypothetical protein
MNLDRATELALRVLDEPMRTRFAIDPLTVIRDDLGLKVQAVNHLTQRRDDAGPATVFRFCRMVSSCMRQQVQVSVKTSLSHTN